MSYQPPAYYATPSTAAPTWPASQANPWQQYSQPTYPSYYPNGYYDQQSQYAQHYNYMYHPGYSCAYPQDSQNPPLPPQPPDNDAPPPPPPGEGTSDERKPADQGVGVQNSTPLKIDHKQNGAEYAPSHPEPTAAAYPAAYDPSSYYQYWAAYGNYPGYSWPYSNVASASVTSQPPQQPSSVSPSVSQPLSQAPGSAVGSYAGIAARPYTPSTPVTGNSPSMGPPAPQSTASKSNVEGHVELRTHATTAPPSGVRTVALKPSSAPKPLTIRPQWSKKVVPVHISDGVGHSQPVADAKPSYHAATTPTATHSTAAEPSSRKQETGAWPQSLNAYVERCFARCKNGEQREFVTTQLKKKINDATSNGQTWTINWDTEPLVAVESGVLVSTSTTPSPSTLKHNHKDKLGRFEERALEFSNERKGSKKKNKKHFDHNDDMQQEHRPYSAEHQKRVQRAGRFGDGRASGFLGGRHDVSFDRKLWVEQAADDDEDMSFDELVIRGTCQGLEKSYFRLSQVPDPSTVRPEPVLRKALTRLVGVLQSKTVNYMYACDQFKALRQDCTVQQLKSEIAVQVYEAHARAALEYGDMAEFNQCQTQLSMLYAEEKPGCRGEFAAYMLLYQTAHARNGLNKALLHTMKSLPVHLRDDPSVRHALQVRRAYMAGDVITFFKLYACAPNLSRALMDLQVPTIRWVALNWFVKCWRPAVPLPVAARTLGFLPTAPSADSPSSTPVLPGCSSSVYEGRVLVSADPATAYSACVDWLTRHGAVVTVSGCDYEAGQLSTDASRGKLVVPEDTTKVAHGDSNLALEDFLARASMKTKI